MEISVSTCFVCGRGIVGPKRFCSERCRSLFDVGWPAYRSEPLVWRGGRNVSVVAGWLPTCASCGSVCLETARKKGQTFCSTRCRDGKNRYCLGCDADLLGTGRRGPYCSAGCEAMVRASTRRRGRRKKVVEASDSQTAFERERSIDEMGTSEGTFGEGRSLAEGSRVAGEGLVA